MEEWKEIEGFPRYMISSYGRIKSIEHKGVKRERILKPTADKEGYLKIGLHSDKQYSRQVARLVAKAFIPNPDNKLEVDHIDRNPSNNEITNLRWVTRKENNDNRDTWSNTNEQYISEWIVRKYYFQYDKNGMTIRKPFKTLEEAKKFKEEFLKP